MGICSTSPTSASMPGRRPGPGDATVPGPTNPHRSREDTDRMNKNLATRGCWSLLNLLPSDLFKGFCLVLLLVSNCGWQWALTLGDPQLGSDFRTTAEIGKKYDECSLQGAAEAGICSPGVAPAAKDGQWPWQAVLLPLCSLSMAQQGGFPFGSSFALSS